MANFGGGYMNDLLMGGPDADILWGGMGDDTLQGGAGNDRLIGGPGGDKLDGGPGDMDIASYTQSPIGVHVDLSTSFTGDVDERPAVREGDAEGDALTGIEFLWGSAFGDILLGNHSPNSLFGNAGDDILHGGGGNDLLRGGPDNDRLGGTAVAQGDGTTVGRDEAGNDTFYGDEGNDELKGGSGHDTLFGGMGNDNLFGDSGNDYLEGGPGADVLMGGAGMDTAGYTMSPEAVMVDLRHPISGVTQAPMGGDAMGDTIGMDIENLRGSMYDDVLIGDNPPATDDPATTADETKAGNKLFGNMGDDMLKGMGGNDTLHGGKGMDTLYGGMGEDKLMGEMGDDALKGQGGDDTLAGGAGADKLFGGTVNADGDPVPDEAGMDTVDYSKSDAGVRIDLSATSRITGRSEPSAEGGHAEGDTLHDIQNVTGSAHTDYLVGDDDDNVLMGMDGDEMDDDSTPRVTEGGLKGMGGNDVLSGGGGMDELDGGAGMDDLWGGDGDDMLMGGAGNDAPFYIAAAEEVTDDQNAVTTPARTAGERATGVDASSLMEPSPARAAAALEAMNIQRAGLFGGGGDDTLEGGGGRDYLHGGFGNDTATYANSAAGVAVNIGEAVNLNPTGAGNDTDMEDPGEMAGATGATSTDSDAGTTDTDANDEGAPEELVSIENLIGSDFADILVGSKGANTLSGGDEGDMLYGQGGDDVLMGGDDADTLTGGSGSDTFVFGRERVTGDTTDPTDTADDVVMDFSKTGGDKIDLTALDLSAAELAAIIAAANDTGDETATGSNRYTYIVDLAPDTADDEADADFGARDIRITMSERFAELDADDFII